MQETDNNQRQVHLEIINLQKAIKLLNIVRDINIKRHLKDERGEKSSTTKISDFANPRTSTPTSFVSVIPLQNEMRENFKTRSKLLTKYLWRS